MKSVRVVCWYVYRIAERFEEKCDGKGKSPLNNQSNEKQKAADSSVLYFFDVDDLSLASFFVLEKTP